MRDTGLPEAPEPRLEPGRPRAFQPGRKPQGPGCPFRLLATYTTRLAANAKAQHLPLGKALAICRRGPQGPLLSLLLPVQRASETCPWLKALVDGGEIFHPLRWTPHEAIQLFANEIEIRTI